MKADFSSLDDYARYVKANIAVGMSVRCCESYEEVKQGDVGTVLKVDNDGLHDLNVQANWQEKGGTYWVRFAVCELMEVSETAASSTSFKVGDKVRVKRTVVTPKYVEERREGWSLRRVYVLVMCRRVYVLVMCGRVYVLVMCGRCTCMCLLCVGRICICYVGGCMCL